MGCLIIYFAVILYNNLNNEGSQSFIITKCKFYSDQLYREYKVNQHICSL